MKDYPVEDEVNPINEACKCRWVEPPASGEILFLSLLMNVCNRTMNLSHTFKWLNEQQYPKNMYEVVVIDDNSDNKEKVFDVIKDIKTKYKDINMRLYETNKKVTWNMNLPFNIIAKKAIGDVLVIFPDDIALIGDYLKTVSYYHSNYYKIALWSKVQELNINLYHAWLGGFEHLDGGLGMSVRKEWIHKIHGLDERMIGRGANMTDLINRLAMVGVMSIKSTKLLVQHLWHAKDFEETRPEMEKWNQNNDRLLDKNQETKTYAPIDVWGELDTLEMIF